MPPSKKAAAKKTLNATPNATPNATSVATTKRWSQHVGETSDAMDLEPDVFKSDDPEEIARSLKRSAERSDRRKAAPFRSAMSMLDFYINRAGHNLKPAQHRVLEKAKDVLRELFGRAEGPVAKKAAGRKAATKKTTVRTATAKTTTAKTTTAKKTTTSKTTAKKATAARSAKKTATKKDAAERR